MPWVIVVEKRGAHPVIHLQENDAHPEFEKRIIELENRIRTIEERNSQFNPPFHQKGGVGK